MVRLLVSWLLQTQFAALFSLLWPSLTNNVNYEIKLNSNLEIKLLSVTGNINSTTATNSENPLRRILFGGISASVVETKVNLELNLDHEFCLEIFYYNNKEFHPSKLISSFFEVKSSQTKT